MIVAVIFSSIGTDVCGVRCLCIGEVQISVVLFSMLLVPLYGAYIASCSSYTEICFCNLYLSLLALTLNFGSFNVWGISVIPGMIVFMTAWEKESFKEKFSKETRLMGLEALTIISLIGSVIIPLWRIRKIIWTFLTKEGEAAYIYDVLQKLLIKALMDAQNMELGARLIVTGAASNVIWMMLISVLENLQWIPFVARSSFLPFYSSGVGNIFACYILTGLIFNIYRSI